MPDQASLRTAQAKLIAMQAFQDGKLHADQLGAILAALEPTGSHATQVQHNNKL